MRKKNEGAVPEGLTVEGILRVATGLLRDGHQYVAFIAGNARPSEGIQRGDYLLINTTEKPGDGDRVAFRYGPGSTCSMGYLRKYDRDNWSLASFNKRVPPTITAAPADLVIGKLERVFHIPREPRRRQKEGPK